MSFQCTIKVLEQSKISPPPHSVPSTTIPLTFLDIQWLMLPPMKRVFFYEFAHPTSYFIDTVLPTFKHSLSLTLQHLFPLAATLVCPPQPNKPHILFNDGDSVQFTVAESLYDFSRLLSDEPKDVRQLHPLVPQFPPACLPTETLVETFHLLALQITVFPNSGICIGITYNHVVADGTAIIYFLKLWASICKAEEEKMVFLQPLPFYNREVIEDPNGLEEKIFNQWWSFRSFSKGVTTASTALEDKVRATFVIGKFEAQRLKEWLSMRGKESSMTLHVSTFVVTCAFIWVCLLKSQETVENKNGPLDDDKLNTFGFLANCRNRYGINAPTNYFGNCIALCLASAKKKELLGENGLFVAAKAIGAEVKSLESGLLERAERWFVGGLEKFEAGQLVTVAGSPKFRVYDTEFGWGRLKKAEVVHIEDPGAFSLGESRDGEGGIEVGLAMGKVQMDAFVSIFEQFKNSIY